ncbi:hypothetical protein [Kineosporia babensis]|uniref:Uncharacterized protein n=1 Tax=Kineosporia babensis TaxID=499548 RepID=A0A9X1N9H3_9ACTN|nr:hypothetical protein [Kineosporia babensis]MCD5309645.1 hypothetical protein [Kineosporia babensis]
MSPMPHLARKTSKDAPGEMERAADEFADQLTTERLHAEMVRRLETLCPAGEPEGFGAVHVVDSTSGLPDEAEVQLAVLHPRHLHDPAQTHGPAAPSAAVQHVLQLVTTHGRQPRTHRNAVIALAADAQHYPTLESCVRDYLAWSHVSAMAHALGLPADAAQEAQALKTAADSSVDAQLLETYSWLLVPVQKDEETELGIRVLTAEGEGSDLAGRAALTLRSESELVTARDDHAIRGDLDGPLTTTWRAGHISLGELWELYTSLPYLPRLRDRSVLEAGLVSAIADELDWQYQGFALADGYDQRKASYLGLRLPGDDKPPEAMVDSTLVVRPDKAVEQRHSDLARENLNKLKTIDHLDHEDPIPPLPRVPQGEQWTPEAALLNGDRERTNTRN